MLSRLFLVYAVVELAAIIALVSTIGWGWTLLALVGTFLVGWGLLVPVMGSHLVRQVGQLRSGLAEPRTAVRDGTLVTLAGALVLVPGLVTTALGLLLLVRPVRSAVGPGLAAIAMRGLRRRMPLLTDTTLFGVGVRDGGAAGDDYIDGEVVDVRDFRPPALPNEPVRGGFPGRPGWD
ncbi:FxsA family protein [Mycobacterium nebraskense]|uniref:Exclusion suppressor FxsA n=1 Tax=Mycobacterium nebraskense TaxID=244292 RepID=A0A1X1YT90_9MYCO|nr:FxsA family protein [Mycobacterium nebraskense]KKC04793.1 exclusion suppressor FxsA [Mycobacterium nebraskense]MBI2695961.1 FxsA family protein [Mycobacterium nebraskense]MCV7119838.1 FxsA family protein [Mycobacterium nebraskense]ORW14319.1 exclusion suppressor FxsA [Mycobacterium nebraskense]